MYIYKQPCMLLSLFCCKNNNKKKLLLEEKNNQHVFILYESVHILEIFMTMF